MTTIADHQDLPFLDGRQLNDLLPTRSLVDWMRAAHRSPPAEVRRAVYSPRGADPASAEVFMTLPAWQPGEALGAKLATIFPRNRSLPTVQALYVLFDGADGRPLAVLDGTELTYRKTACDSALGSELLSRADATSLLMVGCGALAPHLVEAHCAVRPSIHTVMLWNRSPERARALAPALASALASGTRIEVIDDLRTGAARADIISTATMTKDPLVFGADLAPGTHLDLVGAFLPDHREVDSDAVARSEIFVDSRLAAVEEDGDLVIPLNEGVITMADVRADLYELCRGDRSGRSSQQAITLFENGGGGHLDLMTAWFAWTSSTESRTSGRQ